jgi:hypothetical protein
MKMVARNQIMNVFADLEHLVFGEGIYLEGNPVNGTRVIYWMNGNVRSIVQFKDGFRNGVSISFHPQGSISSYRHFRKGTVYGEQKFMAPDGRVLQHRLVNGDQTITMSRQALELFRDYLFSDEERDLQRHFYSMGLGRLAQPK